MATITGPDERLHERLRVDIDMDTESSARLRRSRKPCAHIALETGRPAGANKQAEPVAAAEHRDRRLGRTQDIDAGLLESI